jgi:hypothetical protein
MQRSGVSRDLLFGQRDSDKGVLHILHQLPKHRKTKRAFGILDFAYDFDIPSKPSPGGEPGEGRGNLLRLSMNHGFADECG